MEVAAQLGVPPGRARGLLKDGTPVEIREGVVIYPDQVRHQVLCPRASLVFYSFLTISGVNHLVSSVYKVCACQGLVCSIGSSTKL